MVPRLPGFRGRAVAAAVLAAAAFVAAAAPASAQEFDGQVRTVRDAAEDPGKRLKAAVVLEDRAPDLLATALLDLGKKKETHNTEFLVSYAVQGETRLLRLLAVHAAMGADPDGVLVSFLERTADEDLKQAARAVDAVGLLIGPLKVKSPEAVDRMTALAADQRTMLAIEASRALSRSGDRRLQKIFTELVVSVPGDHARKHAVWGLLDQMGDDRKTEKVLLPLKARKGQERANGAEGVEILKDKEELPFVWNPMGLKNLPDVWAKRPKGGIPEVGIGDPESAAKVQGWIDHLGSFSPAWRQLLGTVVARIVFRPSSEDRIYDPEKRILFINAGELAQCETQWQGAYVLARNSVIGLGTLIGEPGGGHRGWEPAYVEMHTFYLADGLHKPGDLATFVEDNVKRKPWR